MRKQIFGRKFKRDKNERKALFNGLISAMVLNGSIKTTEQKAKAIKGDLEKLVTKAIKGETSKRLLQNSLTKSEIDKMINEIAPRFKNRPGGYTRIIKTGRRFNDDASMVILQWVEGSAVAPALADKESVRTSKKESASKVSVRKTSNRKSSTRTKSRPHSAKASRGKKESK